MSNLVIVESPAKAKTIQKYLGKDFDVIASMGHIRDLPKSKFGVDIENHFEPKYVDMKGKEDVIKQLKSHAAKCDKIYLATDPDREGEAISWHIAQMLHLDMQDNNRVAFNEITKSGVQAGMACIRPNCRLSAQSVSLEKSTAWSVCRKSAVGCRSIGC